MRKRILSITLALAIALGNPINLLQTEAALIQDEQNYRESFIAVATGTLETQNPITTKNSGLTKEQIMDKFVTDYIKDGMSTVEKLDKIGEFVANYSHPGSQNVDIEMIKGGVLVSGYGDCGETAWLIEQLAMKLGYDVRTRASSADAGASKSHVTALVYDGDKTYQVSASEGTGWNGRWFVSDLGSGFEYTAYNEGEIVFKQYDGRTKQINLNDGLKEWKYRPGEGVTHIPVGAFWRTRISSGVTDFIIPSSVRYVSDLSFTGDGTIIFEGDAPEFEGGIAFWGTKAKVYYPSNNKTWTKELMSKAYDINALVAAGSTDHDIEWIPYEGKSEDIVLPEKTETIPPTNDVTDSGNGNNDSEDISCQKDSMVSFKKASITKGYGSSSFKNPVTIIGNGTVTYRSSNPSVATVNQNGTVTIKKIGTTKITASISGTKDYKAARSSYDLTVKKGTPSVTGTSKYTYTGKAIKPKVTVKAGGKKWNSSAYSISYKNNKEPGKATVTIKPKDKNYKTVTWTFSIVPSKVRSLSLKAKKGKLTVTYKKVKGKISGYQISYRKKGQKSWITKNVSSKKDSTTLSVTRKKTYEVKVRAYKKSGNIKLYSAYSNLKKVKVK